MHVVGENTKQLIQQILILFTVGAEENFKDAVAKFCNKVYTPSLITRCKLGLRVYDNSAIYTSHLFGTSGHFPVGKHFSGS